MKELGFSKRDLSMGSFKNRKSSRTDQALKKLIINESPVLTLEISQKKLLKLYNLCETKYSEVIEQFASVQD